MRIGTKRAERALRLVVVILAVWLVSIFQTQVARCQEQSQSFDSISVLPVERRRRLSEIDRAIVLAAIKLSRYNVEFHLQTNYHARWRSIAYPIAQELGTGAFFANTLTDLSQRARGFNDPNLISTRSQKRGQESAIAGGAICGGSSLLQLTQNIRVAGRCRRLYSPKNSVEFVAAVVSEMDDLLHERDRLILSMAQEPDIQLIDLEGRLLRFIESQLLEEFKLWSAASREQEWKENSFYAIDAAQNFVSSASSIVTVDSFKRARLGGGSDILNLASDAMAATNPIIRTLIGRAMRMYQTRHLNAVFPPRPQTNLQSLTDEWLRLQQSSDFAQKLGNASSINVTAALVDQSHRVDRIVTNEEHGLLHTRRVASQQAISGPLIGLANVAQATCVLDSYYNHRGNPVTSNRIDLAGRIIQSVGTSYSLMATPTSAFIHLRKSRELRKAGKLPIQVLQARLRTLGELEEQIITGKLLPN